MSSAAQLIQGAERIARAVVERDTPAGQPLNQTDVLRHRVAALERIVEQLSTAIESMTPAPRGGVPAVICGVPVTLVMTPDGYSVHAQGCVDGLLSVSAWDEANAAWNVHCQIYNEDLAIDRRNA